MVLAGGAGRRAGGQDKLLAPDAAGRPMLMRTLDRLRASRVERIVLVLGHAAAARLAAVMARYGAGHAMTVVQAVDHAEGLAASLRCGIRVAAQEDWRASLVCLADMPLVGADVIDRLLEAHDDVPDRADAVVPLAGGRRGNPILWDRSMFARLLTLQGDRGGRALLQDPCTRVRLVETGDAGVLADFDTPDRLAMFAGTD